MRQLIVYYSRNGKNKRASQDLKQALSCDIEEIIDQDNRQGKWNFFKSVLAARAKKTTMIDPIKSNLDYYDLVILGTPFWAGALPPATRTFLQQNKIKIKRLALISVSSPGQNNNKAVKELETVSGKRIDLKLVMSEDQYEQKTAQAEFEDFIRALKSLKNVKGDLANP